MKILRLMLFFCCLRSIAFSQSDTVIYYGPYWNDTTKDKAEYYRTISKEDDIYRVRDYYISGGIQMKGQYSSLDPEIQEGYFIWYYGNGQKLMEGSYIHGKREGIWTFWFPDGLKKQTMEFDPQKENKVKITWRSKRLKEASQHFEKGLTKKRRKEYQKALTHFQVAIDINPYFAEAYYEIGIIHYRLHEKETGCKELQTAKEYGFYDNNLISKTIKELCD